jgi:6-pyruvoyltetrahydropterin/6-carboxytetrahydropterin synthase
MLVTRVERIEAVAADREGRWRPLSLALEATVVGDVEPSHGMVVNLSEMKSELRRGVTGPLGGQRLDGVDGAPDLPTPEALARGVWEMLGGRLAGRPLSRIRLVGAGSPVAEWNGEEMRVTRIYEFSASHRLHAASLGPEENRRVFGKCNNPAGHGHNYVLEVTLHGAPGAYGELLPAGEFDRVVAREVSERWDHHNLNEDLEEFAGVNPTAEEIARVAWRRLEAPLAAAAEAAGTGARLWCVKLRETARNHVEYFGEDG